MSSPISYIQALNTSGIRRLSVVPTVNCLHTNHKHNPTVTLHKNMTNAYKNVRESDFKQLIINKSKDMQTKI